MIRTQIYIPESIHQIAKAIAEKRDESLAKLLRDLIVQGLTEEKKRLKKKSLSTLAELKISGGPKDLSTDMNTYLYGK